MEVEFWHQRWQAGRIGFHKSEVNPLLVRHFHRLQLSVEQRIFVPLCGKTRDIGWLLDKGCQVAGVELHEPAVQQLFYDLGLMATVTEVGALKRYRARNIDIFVGDIFDLTSDILGTVDAVYDRAALVALPQAMRRRYTARLLDISRRAAQLLLCFEYDQNRMEGPPFSIAPAEIERRYGARFTPRLLESRAVEGLLKGQVEATEHAWLLHHGR